MRQAKTGLKKAKSSSITIQPSKASFGIFSLFFLFFSPLSFLILSFVNIGFVTYTIIEFMYL